jgi:hypothetical protein
VWKRGRDYERNNDCTCKCSEKENLGERGDPSRAMKAKQKIAYPIASIVNLPYKTNRSHQLNTYVNVRDIISVQNIWKKMWECLIHMYILSYCLRLIKYYILECPNALVRKCHILLQCDKDCIAGFN